MNSESKLFGISIDPRLLKAAFKKTEHETTVAQNVDGEGGHDILAVYPLRDNLCDLCFYDRQLLSWRQSLLHAFFPYFIPCAFVLPLVALMQLILGIRIARTNSENAFYHVLSSILVLVLTAGFYL